MVGKSCDLFSDQSPLLFLGSLLFWPLLFGPLFVSSINTCESTFTSLKKINNGIKLSKIINSRLSGLCIENSNSYFAKMY